MNFINVYFRAEGKFAGTTSIRNYLMAHDIRIESNSKETEIDEKQNEKISFDQNKANMANQSLLKFIISGFLPFSILENFHLKRFITIISPKYRLPSVNIISNNMLDIIFNKAIVSIKKDLEQIESICVTTDCWTSIQNCSYMGVTIHFIKPDFFMSSHTIAIKNITGSHTGLHFKNMLTQIFQEWDVERKVEFISTDNASNVYKAISYFNSTIIHMRCMGHILNLIVKKVINYKHDVSYSITATQQASQDSFVDFDEENDENETDVAGYSDLIIPFTFSLNEMNSIKKFRKLTKKARIKCSKFSHSTLLSDALAEKQENEKEKFHLVQEFATRWNSTYKMLNR